MKRVLHLLSHDRLKSGGAFQAMLLARAQQKAGLEVSFAFNSGREPELARQAFDPLRQEGFECEPLVMQHLGRIRGLRRFRELVARSRPDVVHAHRERAMRFAVDALKNSPREVLFAQKGNCYGSDRKTAAAYRSPRLDRIVAVCEAVKRVLVVKDRVPAEKIAVVYGSFDPERFTLAPDRAVARAELDLSAATPVVGVLANLDRKKGHDAFLRAARIVLQSRPDCLFLLIGGGDLERARRLAREAGVLESVRLTGFRADAERMLAALDVSVISSHGGEGLTGALRESLALGIPVVSTHVGGNAEIVENGVTGLLVGPGSEQDLAGAILHHLDHPDQAAKMAGEGKRRVWEWMDNDHRCERVLSLYREALRWRRLAMGEPDPDGEEVALFQG